MAPIGRSGLLPGVMALLVVLALIWKTNLEVVGSFEESLRRGDSGGLLEDIVNDPLGLSDKKGREKYTNSATKLGEEGKASQNSTSSPPAKFHLVMSTGCSTFQDWQSYTFFYFAMASGQAGEATRVASGCSPGEALALQKQFDEQIRPMSPAHFHLHLTPNYSKAAGNKHPYKFFNKPMGLRHWMEHGLGFPHSSENDDTIFVVLDPDQFILQPFVQDFTDQEQLWITDEYRKVEKGRPMAAAYGFATDWIYDIDIDGILNSSTMPSPLRTWQEADIRRHYTVGPPYLAVGLDMFQIVKTWSEFVIPIFGMLDVWCSR